jgi:hypothetical protein
MHDAGGFHPASLSFYSAMKIEKFLPAAILMLCAEYVLAQEITQTVKGRVTDQVSNSPLSGASVQIISGAGNYGGQTDDNGYFTVAVPVGRYKISVSYTGYAAVQQELLVISGREAVANVALTQASQTLEAVEVSGAAVVQELPGQRSLTIEKTLRVPANFFDPVRVATAYPGVIAANDQNNAIIVRGNSPNGLLWRLNGVDIVNPNHLANAGTLSDRPSANGGGVNILSAQMLDRTDFYMGAFPSCYGNALSGVVDMKLREGNKDKMEYTAQASVIGLDVAAEGPLGKEGNTAFLANYRYSTVGLLSQLGVGFGDEAITFQDLSFHLHSQGKKGAGFSLFGFYGNSKNDFKAKEPEAWEEDKDKYDILYKSATYAAGMSYTVPVYGGKVFAGLAYSNGNQERNAVISNEVVSDGQYLLAEHYELTNGLLSASVKYEKLLGETVWQIGVMANYLNNDLGNSMIRGRVHWWPVFTEEIKGANEGFLLQPFTNFAIPLSPVFTLNTGLRYVTYTYNNARSLEPRVSVNLKTSENSGFDMAYSLVSQLQQPQVYAADGNEDLGFTRSHHVDLGYTRSLTSAFDFRAGLFYQYLFDVPVLSNSTFSTVNLLEGFVPGHLANNGTGANYGADVMFEKHFYTSHYFMIGGSYYESNYTGGDGTRRSTRFNGNYTVNSTYGKEWNKPEKNRTIGLNARVLYLGGLRQSPVNVTASQDSWTTVYDDTDPYSEKMKDYFRLDLRLSFRKNKPRYTRTFAVDVQNLTNQQNEASRYYDFTQRKVVTRFQLGIIPVLVYRIDF